jgi:hypothetical protein
MAVGDKLRAEVPAALEPGIASFFFRVARVLAALRDQVESLTQRLEAKHYAPDDAELGRSEIWFWVDEGANKLKVRVRYQSGALKTGEVNLV